jgi:hypothetical protein
MNLTNENLTRKKLEKPREVDRTRPGSTAKEMPDPFTVY